jgi:hypothetical protein
MIILDYNNSYKDLIAKEIMVKIPRTLFALMVAGSLVGCDDGSRGGSEPIPTIPEPRREVNLHCHRDKTPESGGSRQNTRLLMHNGDEATYIVENLQTNAVYDIHVMYANDSYQSDLEKVSLNLNGVDVGSFRAEDTGNYGHGWFNPRLSPLMQHQTGPLSTQTIRVKVNGGDRYGVQLHNILLAINEDHPDTTSN